MESSAGHGKDASVEANGQPRVAYKTSLGRSFLGQAENVLQLTRYQKTLHGQVDLIFTSPPFPLNRKKKYGNEQGEAYVKWLADFAPLFKKVLKPKGSIVLELGNAWEAGRPVMSTLALKALLAFLERGKFILCQQFVWYNPARLPSPAQWVNVERIRVKDAYTHLWWMSTTDRPHADNRRILTKYSESMEKLLERQEKSQVALTSPPALTDHTMAKLTKETLTKKIQERTGFSRRKAQKGLKGALFCIKRAFGDGKDVELPGIGRLVVVERPRKWVIRKNMKGRPTSIVGLHKKYPKSVRLLGGKDMSDDPKPTIVHKKDKPGPVPARFRHIAIAFPAWRRRHKFR